MFAGATGSGFLEELLLDASLGALAGATNGVILFSAIFGAEIFLPPTRLGYALERVPFLVIFAIKLLVYGGVIVLVVGGRPGWHLVGAVAAMLHSPDLATAIGAHINLPTAPSIVRGFLLVGVGLFVLR